MTAKNKDKSNISQKLLQNMDDYMLRCGIYEPYDKIYVKNIPEFQSIDIGRLLAIVLITQLPKLQICFTTGRILSQCNL